MSGVIPANVSPPLPISDDFISSNDKRVVFINFKADHTELRPEHDAFIEKILVPFYINQIEALGFFDKSMTLRPIGKASATGPRDHNMTLSKGRANAVGVAVKKYFDQQKSRGVIARNVNVVINPIGEGDKEERTLIGPPVRSPKAYEDQSNGYRSVLLSMLVQHDVVDDDQKIFCRQLLNAKVKATTVPPNLLEQKIEELEKKIPPEIKAIADLFLDKAKKQANEIVKLLLEGADFLGPEVFIVKKGIQFIVPSDIALLFEFKDSRARTKRYIFSGSANKVDIGALEIFCKLLSVIKWMTELPEELQELELALEKKDRKLASTTLAIEKLEKLIEKAELGANIAKKTFEGITAKNSFSRKVFGDGKIDLILKAVEFVTSAFTGEVQVATDFALVRFDISGVFDIFFFNGAAQVETAEHRGSPTTVRLDFAAPKNQPLLGFKAHALMRRQFDLGFSLGSFEISRGNLTPS